jgi:peroxiredoxin
MNGKTLTLLTVTAILVLQLCGCGSKKSEAAPEIGGMAPEFTLKNYDGTTVSLSDYKGKIVVLEWFNYECPFVKYHYEKAQTMTTLASKYKDKSVVWLAINSTGHLTTDKNKQFAEKHNIEFPILDDRTGKTGRAYGAKTTPHMFIIDTDGKIAYEGAIDNSPLGRTEDVVNYVDKILSELTLGNVVSITNTEPYGCSVKYAN